jgi:hypothetical protein
MENATLAFLNEAIDDLQSDLESLRQTPSWAVVVIVLISLISCFIGCMFVVTFVVKPTIEFLRAFAIRRQAEATLDFAEGIRMPGKMTNDGPSAEVEADGDAALEPIDDDVSFPKTKKKKKKGVTFTNDQNGSFEDRENMEV